MNLKQQLKDAGINQRQFAQYVGVDPRTVRRWVKDQPPRIALLALEHYKDTHK